MGQPSSNRTGNHNPRSQVWVLKNNTNSRLGISHVGFLIKADHLSFIMLGANAVPKHANDRFCRQFYPHKFRSIDAIDPITGYRHKSMHLRIISRHNRHLKYLLKLLRSAGVPYWDGNIKSLFSVRGTRESWVYHAWRKQWKRWRAYNAHRRQFQVGFDLAAVFVSMPVRFAK